MKKLILAIFLIILFSGEAGAVDVRPSRLELEVSPGEVFQGKLEVINDRDYAIDLFISTDEYAYLFLDWTTAPQDKQKQRLPSCASWIKFASSEVRLRPGEKSEVSYSLSVPKDSRAEHVASILFDENRVEEGEKAIDKNVVNLILRRREAVYVMVKDMESPSLEIKDVKIDKSDRRESLEVTIKILNTGNIHLRPNGKVVVQYAAGGVIEETAQFKTLPLFPYYQGEIRVPLRQLPGQTDYALTVEIDIGSSISLDKTVFFSVNDQGEVLH